MDQHVNLNQAVADALGVSVSLMGKTLASEGTSLSREIKTLKCEVACELLTNLDIPIADVGVRIGFTEPANFTRFFKSQLGQTPRQFRNCRNSETKSE